MPEDRLLTEAEVAELWNVTTGRVAQCRVHGNGPPFLKLPTGEIRYRSSDVLEWLESRRRTRTSHARSAGAASSSDLDRTHLVRIGQELIAMGSRVER